MKGQAAKRPKSLVPVEQIERAILLIRGQRVMLDRDLAELYGVETRMLKQAVRRNVGRFPGDFMFELTKEEARSLRSQNVTLKRGGHSKYLPFAFTEQGVAMLSSVLNSARAIEVNIAIMRAFVRLRELVSTHKKLELKLSELERKMEKHDESIETIFEAIRQLMTPPEERRRKIGFEVKEKRAGYGKWATRKKS
jgi:phage regulator Rha-like protein